MINNICGKLELPHHLSMAVARKLTQGFFKAAKPDFEDPVLSFEAQWLRGGQALYPGKVTADVFSDISLARITLCLHEKRSERTASLDIINKQGPLVAIMPPRMFQALQKSCEREFAPAVTLKID